ncbi:hypothetical protein GKIL_4350 [Gloeobacter kilaueensis JS1]|uniref:Uncharacterized protein n=2 Tax=Gloeobacter TaxID=33071 RepID=U5QNT3_GLOK1|nr:hypothetical protein GKIL_4350 [Gloeobacter kilaueensis JS1]
MVIEKPAGLSYRPTPRDEYTKERLFAGETVDGLYDKLQP